jgi:hypothetical protein
MAAEVLAKENTIHRLALIFSVKSIYDVSKALAENK